MLQPEVHLGVVRDRHSYLLRHARAGELAARLGEYRRAERRSFLARLHSRPEPARRPPEARPANPF